MASFRFDDSFILTRTKTYNPMANMTTMGPHVITPSIRDCIFLFASCRFLYVRGAAPIVGFLNIYLNQIFFYQLKINESDTNAVRARYRSYADWYRNSRVFVQGNHDSQVGCWVGACRHVPEK